MKKIYAVIWLFATFSVLADEKLVFATHSRPPVSLYLQDVIKEALKPYSIESEVQEMPGSRVIFQVNNGIVDGDLSRVKNLKDVSDTDTSNYRLVDEPVVIIEIVLITLAHKKIIQPITWDTINQGAVAFARGSKTIRNNLNEYNRVSLSSVNQILEVVANGRVDSAVMFASVAENLLGQSTELNQKLKIHKPPVMTFPLYIYLHKKHSELIPKLVFSLKQLKSNGFLLNTANKYKVKSP